MRLIMEKLWNMFCQRFGEYQYNDSGMQLNANKKDIFEKAFQRNYKKFKNDYMYRDVEYLDRHKVAAIAIISFIESDAIICKGISEDCVFIGLEVISLEIGLSYLLSELNEKLKGKGRIEKFSFPQAFSCSTNYIEIMARILYLSKRDYQLNPLDLSERLFLLEYITLKDAKIDMSFLREY